jgi:hypothetical protein
MGILRSGLNIQLRLYDFPLAASLMLPGMLDMKYAAITKARGDADRAYVLLYHTLAIEMMQVVQFAIIYC